MKPEHVFIVGVFRSGTTLLRKILNNSKEISICQETGFFGSLLFPGFRKKFRQVGGEMITNEDVYEVVDFIYRTKVGQWWWILENIDKEYFTQQLLETDRSDRAIFELAMRMYARGKPIVGEKTPAHLYSVPILLDFFPNSKIIHTFRDPRAIFVSELRKKEQPIYASTHHKRLRSLRLLVPFIALQTTIVWLRAAHLHKRYQMIYPDRYLLIKFEDLVSHSERNLQLLGDFLKVDLPSQILEGVVSNSSFADRRGKVGIHRNAINRWQEHISPWITRVFQLFCRKQLREFGYHNSLSDKN